MVLSKKRWHCNESRVQHISVVSFVLKRKTSDAALSIEMIFIKIVNFIDVVITKLKVMAIRPSAEIHGDLNSRNPT